MREPDKNSAGAPAATDLEALVVQAIDRLDREGASALETMCQEHPGQAEALRRRIEVLREAGLLSAPESAEPPEFPERLGDFRLLERLGAGGMGVVYRARQESLGREVALKVIRPDQLFFPDARSRFRREVEAIARLQHPGIVPIYTVGEQDGVPYFAMEHVHGCTLLEVVEELSGRDPAELEGRDLDRAIARVTGDRQERLPAARFSGTWTQACLGILRDVCDALEHAHRRGVVHRDLKPSNVIVTREGRVMLLDFGLSSSSETARITRTGTLVGSLPYAAPETLAGEDTEQQSTIDIYALGVTMYELLALRLPFEGGSALELRAQVLAAAPVPLRRLNARVSRDVETVCAVAMDPSPARRYASAQAFGRDLTNVLELRPLEARRTGPLLRARRWARRHPAWVVSAALALLAVLVGPSVYAWQQRELRATMERKNAELEHSNTALAEALDLAGERGRQAAAERDRAEASFWRAVTATDDLLSQVGAFDLDEVPQMGPVQCELLTRALAYYDGFVAERGNEPRLHKSRAAIRIHLGRALYASGRVVESIATYRDATEELEAVCAQDPRDFDARNALAQSLRWTALSLGALRRREEQTEVSQRTLAAYESLRKDFPDRPNATCDAASFYGRMGEIELRASNPEGARDWYQRAATTLEGLHADYPENATYTLLLADALRDLGSALDRAGLPAQAEDALRRSVELARASARAQPSKLSRRFLGLSLMRLASFLTGAGRWQEALPLHEESLELTRALAREYPSMSFVQTDYLGALANLSSRLLEDRHDEEAAARILAEAEPAAAAALERFPDELTLRTRAAGIARSAAALAQQQGDWESALSKIEQATGELESVLARDPEDRDSRERLTLFKAQRAEIVLQSGDWMGAQQAVADYVATDPDAAHVRLWAARYYARAARLAEEDPDVADEDQRFARVGAYRDSVLESLRTAVALGLEDAAELEATDDFDDYRSEPAYRALLSELSGG